MKGHKKDVAEHIQTLGAPVRGQEMLVKAPRAGKQYRTEDCQCTGACIPGWRQAALPGSLCQAGWEVLTQTTKPQPAAAAVLPGSLTTLWPAKAGMPHRPRKAPVAQTVSQHSTGEGLAVPPSLFPTCSRNHIQTAAITIASALAEQTPLLQDHQDRKSWKNHSAKDVSRLCEPCTPGTLSPQGKEQVFCAG